MPPYQRARDGIFCDGHCFGPSITEMRMRPLPGDLLPSSHVGEGLMSDVLPEYTYIPLEPGEIRVLCLDAGACASPLSGELVTVVIALVDGRLQAIRPVQGPDAHSNHILDFCALSYTWGNPEKTAAMAIEGKMMRITANLEEALLELRTQAKPIHVWVDALCINQDDFAERVSQVAIMLEIYRTATKVCVWLGRSDLLSQTCIERLQRPGLRSYAVSASAKPTVAPPLASNPHLVHSDSCKSTQDSLYYALQQLYSRPWLRRVWVRQEVFGGREIEVMCGSGRISWSDFLKGIDLFRSLEQSCVESSEAAMLCSSVLQSLKDLTKDAPNPRTGSRPFQDLVSVLVSTRDLEAGEKNDRVFATLGMCGGPTTAEARFLLRVHNMIRIDYEKPFSDTLQDTTVYLLKQASLQNDIDAHVDALAGIFHYHARREIDQRGCQSQDQSQGFSAASAVPSWVVDWSKCCSPQEALAIRTTYQHIKKGRSGHLRISGASAGRCLFSIDVSPILKSLPVARVEPILRIRALVLDTVKSLTDETWDLNSFLDPASFWELFRKFGRLKYDASIHCRRAANLLHLHANHYDGRSKAPHDVLVPAGTKPGDLLVVAAPGVLPLVLSPAGSQQEDKRTVEL